MSQAAADPHPTDWNPTSRCIAAHKTVFEEDSLSRERKGSATRLEACASPAIQVHSLKPKPNQTKPKQQWSSYSLRRCHRLQALFHWGEAATTREIGGKNGPCTPYTYKIHRNVKYLLWSLTVLCNSSDFQRTAGSLKYSTKQRTYGSFFPFKKSESKNWLFRFSPKI